MALANFSFGGILLHCRERGAGALDINGIVDRSRKLVHDVALVLWRGRPKASAKNGPPLLRSSR
ncbi:MAG: hypothetical protein ACREI3_02670, partial [Nitrospirales bacterium]